MSTHSPTARAVGRPSKTDEERAHQRSRILAAAVQVIRSDGPDVSLDAIASEAGYAKPLIYDLFGSKAGLAAALSAETVGQRLLSDMPAEVEATLFRRLIAGYVDFVETDANVYRFTVVAGRAGSASFVDQPLVQLLRGYLVHMMRVEEATAGVAVNAVLAMVFAGVEGWSYTRDLSAQAVVDILAAMTEAALVPLIPA
jgi:AcrR family transcriptional regulator